MHDQKTNFSFQKIADYKRNEFVILIMHRQIRQINAGIINRSCEVQVKVEITVVPENVIKARGNVQFHYSSGTTALKHETRLN